MTRIVYTGTRQPADTPGVELHHLPMLEAVALPLPRDLAGLLADGSDRIAIFYSQNAAKHVFSALTPDDFTGVEVWAVGEKTAGWLADRLETPVHSPATEDFDTLLDELRDAVTPQTSVFSFELESSPRRLQDAGLDARVLSVATYETLPCNWDDLDGLLRRIDPRWVVFASPRGYSAFQANLHHRPVGDSYRVAVIGPNTRDEIVAGGGRVDLVPDSPDLEALLLELAGS